MSRSGTPEVVVITGASGGVDRASAIAFARQGARVGLLARGPFHSEAHSSTLPFWANTHRGLLSIAAAGLAGLACAAWLTGDRDARFTGGG